MLIKFITPKRKIRIEIIWKMKYRILSFSYPSTLSLKLSIAISSFCEIIFRRLSSTLLCSFGSILISHAKSKFFIPGNNSLKASSGIHIIAALNPARPHPCADATLVDWKIPDTVTGIFSLPNEISNCIPTFTSSPKSLYSSFTNISWGFSGIRPAINESSISFLFCVVIISHIPLPPYPLYSKVKVADFLNVCISFMPGMLPISSFSLSLRGFPEYNNSVGSLSDFIYIL